MRSLKNTLKQKIGITGAIVGVGAIIIGSQIKSVAKQIKKAVKQLALQPNRAIETQNKQPQNQEYDDLQNLMICPISLQIMKEPCILSCCGHGFERVSIEKWVSQHRKCPICQIRATRSDIKPNYQLKEIILQHKKNKRILAGQN